MSGNMAAESDEEEPLKDHSTSHCKSPGANSRGRISKSSRHLGVASSSHHRRKSSSSSHHRRKRIESPSKHQVSSSSRSLSRSEGQSRSRSKNRRSTHTHRTQIKGKKSARPSSQRDFADDDINDSPSKHQVSSSSRSLSSSRSRSRSRSEKRSTHSRRTKIREKKSVRPSSRREFADDDTDSSDESSNCSSSSSSSSTESSFDYEKLSNTQEHNLPVTPSTNVRNKFSMSTPTMSRILPSKLDSPGVSVSGAQGSRGSRRIKFVPAPKKATKNTRKDKIYGPEMKTQSEHSTNSSVKTKETAGFEVTNVSGNISTWEMRRRFQREFPSEPVPSDTVLRQLYRGDKLAAYERQERFQRENPGEPIPSDEVLTKLYPATPGMISAEKAHSGSTPSPQGDGRLVPISPVPTISRENLVRQGSCLTFATEASWDVYGKSSNTLMKKDNRGLGMGAMLSVQEEGEEDKAGGFKVSPELVSMSIQNNSSFTRVTGDEQEHNFQSFHVYPPSDIMGSTDRLPTEKQGGQKLRRQDKSLSPAKSQDKKIHREDNPGSDRLTQNSKSSITLLESSSGNMNGKGMKSDDECLRTTFGTMTSGPTVISEQKESNALATFNDSFNSLNSFDAKTNTHESAGWGAFPSERERKLDDTNDENDWDAFGVKQDNPDQTNKAESTRNKSHKASNLGKKKEKLGRKSRALDAEKSAHGTTKSKEKSKGKTKAKQTKKQDKPTNQTNSMEQLKSSEIDFNVSHSAELFGGKDQASCIGFAAFDGEASTAAPIKDTELASKRDNASKPRRRNAPERLQPVDMDFQASFHANDLFASVEKELCKGFATFDEHITEAPQNDFHSSRRRDPTRCVTRSQSDGPSVPTKRDRARQKLQSSKARNEESNLFQSILGEGMQEDGHRSFWAKNKEDADPGSLRIEPSKRERRTARSVSRPRDNSPGETDEEDGAQRRMLKADPRSKGRSATSGNRGNQRMSKDSWMCEVPGALMQTQQNVELELEVGPSEPISPLTVATKKAVRPIISRRRGYN